MRAVQRTRVVSWCMAPFAALALATAAAASGPGTAPQAPSASEAFSLRMLAPADAQAYATAFALMREGRFEAAEAAARAVTTPLLQGRLAFTKLMHPGYRSSYEELSAWLASYRDQPEAARIYALAQRRRPAGAAPPLAPLGAGSSDWARIEAHAERLEARATPQGSEPDRLAAREAFYGGEVARAHTLAVQSGEHWIAGLAAFQLKRFAEARMRFATLAVDESKDEWVRSRAAYWAARAAIASGEPEAAPQYLTIAARTPFTFYGLIAERQLGLEPAIGPGGLDAGPAPERVEASWARSPVVAGPDGAAIARLVRSDPRAGRAAAFAQIGLNAEAGQELRAAIDAAGQGADRTWRQLALALNVPLTTRADLPRRTAASFDLAQFPTPELSPQGGFTLDRALVYAVVRQESRFDPAAASGAGAQGLMQLMPDTAARISGDAKLARNPALLKDPGLNLRLGQDYLTRLLEVTNGDLLQAVAAYNSGPGTILRTLSRLGAEADSLMAIESMPGAQTREFVAKVVANYWIYRNIFGQDSRTLDAVASGAKSVLAAADLPAQALRADATVLSSFFAAAR